MKIAVVIAAYDERDSIEALTRRLATTLEALAETTWEAWFVVEGQDGTRAILERLRTEERWPLHVLYQERPQGLGRAFAKGFAALPDDIDYVVTMDADLNHQPEELPRLVGELVSRNLDILIGSRFLPASVVVRAPLWKRFLSGTMNRLMGCLYGLRVADKTSGYRVYRRQTLQAISFRTAHFAFLPEILILAARQDATIGEAPIRFVFRNQGRSKMKILATTASYLGLIAARFRPAGRVALPSASARAAEERRPTFLKARR